MAVSSTRLTSVAAWNALIAGINERITDAMVGAGIAKLDLWPSANAARTAARLQALRDKVEAVMAYYYDEANFVTWTLSTILTHLGIGAGSPPDWTTPDLTPDAAGGRRVRIEHYNDLEAVVKELRWHSLGFDDDTQGEKYGTDASEATAYSNAGSATPTYTQPSATCRGGHHVGTSPVTYTARRYRGILTAVAAGIGGSPTFDGSKMEISFSSSGGRSLVMTVGTVGSAADWGPGSSIGTVADGATGILTGGAIALPAYYCISADREAASDRPTAGQSEYSGVTLMTLLGRRSDFAFV